ncbi:pecanex-like protein 3 isoform 2-T2 [Passerculus sandwichensis]
MTSSSRAPGSGAGTLRRARGSRERPGGSRPGPGAAMAGEAVLQVLRQGVWASLTGGCFLEPQLGAFANCVRLYVWLFLLGLPLGLYSALPPSRAVPALYCALVAAFFGAVKAVTFRLHARLDRDRDRGDPRGDPEGGAAALLPPRERDGSPPPPGGALELSVLRWPSATPPQLCGFNQLSSSRASSRPPTGTGSARRGGPKGGSPIMGLGAMPGAPPRAPSPTLLKGWGSCLAAPPPHCPPPSLGTPPGPPLD